MKHLRLTLLWLAIMVSLGMAPASRADLIGRYPSPEALEAEVRAMAAARPDRIELIEYGRSGQGRPLLALRFHAGDGAERPGGMVAGNIHGEEWIGSRAALAVARRVAEGLDADEDVRDLLRRMDIYVLPCLNPDGYAATWEARGHGDFNRLRQNAAGVDLNRNFPPPHGEKMERQDASSPVYAGPAPLSEPETRAVADFALARRIFATVDYHSVLGVFGTPTCYSPACVARYEKMCWAYSRHQRRLHYLWMVLPNLTGREWFPGQMEPYLYHRHGIMGILIELGIQPINQLQNRSSEPFETFNPKDPEAWAQNEPDAALSALDAAFRATNGRPVPESER
jgi:hypothetical protein